MSMPLAYGSQNNRTVGASLRIRDFVSQVPEFAPPVAKASLAYNGRHVFRHTSEITIDSVDFITKKF